MKRSSMRWSTIVVLLCFVRGAAGCDRQALSPLDARAALTLDPTPPVVGDTDVSLELTDAAGEPLAGARVLVEGNMNHAGMKPSFADLEEGEPGRYTGTLEFTMGGDWFLLVTATTPDGKTMERRIDVRGVKSK